MYTFILFEFIALIVMLVQFGKVKSTIYKYFLPYLIFIVFFEVGNLMHWFGVTHNHRSNNLWISNIEITIEFVFFNLFLNKLLNRLKTGFMITSLVVLVSAIDIIFIQGIWELGTFAILLQYCVLITMVCRFFYTTIKHIDIRINILKMPSFWLNTGLLFFCLSEFLFFSSFTYMAYKNNYHYLIFFFTINNLANVILYSCLTISFLCISKTIRL